MIFFTKVRMQDSEVSDLPVLGLKNRIYFVWSCQPHWRPPCGPFMVYINYSWYTLRAEQRTSDCISSARGLILRPHDQNLEVRINAVPRGC